MARHNLQPKPDPTAKKPENQKVTKLNDFTQTNRDEDRKVLPRAEAVRLAMLRTG